MSELVYLANFPGLRIENDREAFAGLTLYRLPFEEYDGLTCGAFEEYAADYASTQPVFLAWDQEIDLAEPPPDAGPVSALQLKRPFRATKVLSDVGLGPLDGLLDHMDGIVLKAWSVLSLACPMSSLISPRYSVAFLHVQGGGCFLFQDNPIGTIQVQGEADQEYLFSPALRSAPVSAETLRTAEQLLPLVETIETQAPLQSALNTLLYSQTPLVSPSEQLTLCVMALETLLLADDTSQLRKTFARRLTALCASPADGDPSQELARTLYDRRSANLHGKPADAVAAQESAGAACRLLAESIVRLASAVNRGDDLGAALARLDDDDGDGGGNGNGMDMSDAHLPAATGARPADRLNRHKESTVSSLTSTMGMKDEDTEFLWSPLIGLAVEADNQVIGTARPHVVMPLSARELGDLEDRDIRRDFLEGLMGYESVGKDIGKARSVLLTVDRITEGMDPQTPMAERLRNQVGNAVLALRLAGLHRFCDPDLLGKYFYRGTIRFRRATVLRQTVLAKHIEAPDQLTAQLSGRVGQLLDLVVAHDDAGAHPDMAYVASLYRRSFSADYLSPAISATLVFASLEGIVGRFRPPDEQPQLEDYVDRLASADDGDWFRSHGRRCRNDAAHGRWPDDAVEPLHRLWSVVGAVLEHYLRFVVTQQECDARPARAFRRHVDSWT